MTGRRRPSRRGLAALALAAMVVAVVPTAAAAQAADMSDASPSVCVAARRLDDGRVEFALQLADGQRWLPRARFYPYRGAEIRRWLRSSPYTMSDGTEVRIRAQRLASGKVKFALQVGETRQWLPTARLFPYLSARVGRWLFSSCYFAGAATLPLRPAPAAAPAPVAPTPAPTPPPPDPVDVTCTPLIYTIQAGDTLFSIAQRFDVTLDALLETNNIGNPGVVYAGDTLSIPPASGCPTNWTALPPSS